MCVAVVDEMVVVAVVGKIGAVVDEIVALMAEIVAVAAGALLNIVW